MGSAFACNNTHGVKLLAFFRCRGTVKFCGEFLAGGLILVSGHYRPEVRDSFLTCSCGHVLQTILFLSREGVDGPFLCDAGKRLEDRFAKEALAGVVPYRYGLACG